MVKDASTSPPDGNNIKSYNIYPHGFLIKIDTSFSNLKDTIIKNEKNMQFSSGFPLNDMNSTFSYTDGSLELSGSRNHGH